MSELDLFAAIRPAEVTVGEVVYRTGGRFGPRRQRNLVGIGIVYAGCVRIEVDDQPTVAVPAQSVGLIVPGHREYFEIADATHHAWIELALIDPPSALLHRLSALPRMLPASSALDALVAEAIAADRTPLSTARPLLTSLAVAAVLRYVGEAESRQRGIDDAVERARRFLNAHVSDRGIDLTQVAQAAHVSPSHLVRRFRAELGVTPMAYLWHRRVANGIDLLAQTGLSVGEIAARCGFTSVYHFSRRIKAHTGLPPTEVRRRRWNPDTDPESQHATATSPEQRR